LISNSFDALAHLFHNNSNVTSLLGKFQGTSIPLVVGGEMAETETDLPAIIYYPENGNPTLYLRDQRFLVNCYAATTREAFILSQTLIDEFNDTQYIADGYPIKINCNSLITVIDPQSKEVNTPVEFRVVNIKKM